MPLYYERWIDGQYRWLEAQWCRAYVEFDGRRRRVDWEELLVRGFTNRLGTLICSERVIEAGIALYKVAAIDSGGRVCRTFSTHPSLADATRALRESSGGEMILDIDDMPLDRATLCRLAVARP